MLARAGTRRGDHHRAEAEVDAHGRAKPDPAIRGGMGRRTRGADATRRRAAARHREPDRHPRRRRRLGVPHPLSGGDGGLSPEPRDRREPVHVQRIPWRRPVLRAVRLHPDARPRPGLPPRRGGPAAAFLHPARLPRGPAQHRGVAGAGAPGPDAAGPRGLVPRRSRRADPLSRPRFLGGGLRPVAAAGADLDIRQARRVERSRLVAQRRGVRLRDLSAARPDAHPAERGDVLRRGGAGEPVAADGAARRRRPCPGPARSA